MDVSIWARLEHVERELGKFRTEISSLVKMNKPFRDFVPEPENHGEPWSERDEDRLLWTFRQMCANFGNEFQRTPEAVRMKVMRILKKEYPVAWRLINREVR